jgi:hypothetical protein
MDFMLQLPNQAFFAQRHVRTLQQAIVNASRRPSQELAAASA